MAHKTMMQDLSALVGESYVMGSEDSCSQYQVDGRIPKAVLFPADTEQVAAIVRYAARQRLAVLPWGSGTKMGMGNPPKELDLVISTARINTITDIDVENLTITVQAGVKFADAQTALAAEEDRCYLPLEETGGSAEVEVCSDRSHSGCFIPLDPPFADLSTMGGLVAANINGPRRLLYGLPRDLVLGVRFVAPDGAVIGAGGKTVKNVSGYDIAKLMTGSMGTLGILCEMTFRLLPLPERMETLVFLFDSQSAAAVFGDRILDTPLLPAAVEVVNRQTVLGLNLENVPAMDPRQYAVAVALEGPAETVVRMRKELSELAIRSGLLHQERFGEEGHRRFWAGISNLLRNARAQFGPIIALQIRYPTSKWTDLVSTTTAVLTSRHIEFSLLSHVGSGLSLLCLQTETETEADLNRIVRSIREVDGRLQGLDARISILEAPLAVKNKFPVWGSTREDLMVMKRIKKELDPLGIMSPGRFVGGL